MKHDNKDLKNLFAETGRRIPIDGKRKGETLQLLYREAAAIRPFPVRDKRPLLIDLVRYADKELPCVHLLSCIVLLLLPVFMSIRQASAQTMLCLSLLLPCCLALLSVLEIRQICFTKMAELSETCFFHVRQLAALSMLLSGILNLTALSACILFVGLQWKIKLLQIAVYTLVPFLFVQCASFGCLLTETGRRHPWLNVPLCILPAAFCAILFSDRALYTGSALCFWAFALPAGILLLAFEIRTFFVKLGKGELICITWN